MQRVRNGNAMEIRIENLLLHCWSKIDKIYYALCDEYCIIFHCFVGDILIKSFIRKFL